MKNTVYEITDNLTGRMYRVSEDKLTSTLYDSIIVQGTDQAYKAADTIVSYLTTNNTNINDCKKAMAYLEIDVFCYWDF